MTPPLRIRFSGKGLPEACVLQDFLVNSSASAAIGQFTIYCNSGNRTHT
jgi:hypothetical protein